MWMEGEFFVLSCWLIPFILTKNQPSLSGFRHSVSRLYLIFHVQIPLFSAPRLLNCLNPAALGIVCFWHENLMFLEVIFIWSMLMGVLTKWLCCYVDRLICPQGLLEWCLILYISCGFYWSSFSYLLHLVVVSCWEFIFTRLEFLIWSMYVFLFLFGYFPFWHLESFSVR